MCIIRFAAVQVDCPECFNLIGDDGVTNINDTIRLCRIYRQIIVGKPPEPLYIFGLLAGRVKPREMFIKVKLLRVIAREELIV